MLLSKRREPWDDLGVIGMKGAGLKDAKLIVVNFYTTGGQGGSHGFRQDQSSSRPSRHECILRTAEKHGLRQTVLWSVLLP